MAVFPVCLSPIISSLCPLPTGMSESIAFNPVCMGSLTDSLGIIPGALVSTLDLLTFGDNFSPADIDSSSVVSHIGSTVRHELVHMKQIQKQADNKGVGIEDAFDQMLSDPRQYSMGGTKQDYLSSHIEVDAYAHEAADELLKKHSLDDALSILRDAEKGDAPSAIKQYANNMRGKKQYNDFLKKVYTYLMILSK